MGIVATCALMIGAVVRLAMYPTIARCTLSLRLTATSAAALHHERYRIVAGLRGRGLNNVWS
jgi:hypothetical protein